MPVLDTSFLIALQQQDADAAKLLEELASESLLVPAMVAAEYLTGHEDPGLAVQDLEASFALVHTSGPWVLAASDHRRGLIGKGVVRSADLWIATWAALYKTYVVTRNVRHFAALGVETRSW